MRVFEAMSHDVTWVGPEATLADAARLMGEHDLGPLPVCESSRLVGTLAERDIAVRAAARGRDPRTTRVAEVMTPEAACCFEADDVEQAAELMRRERLRRLLVIDPQGHLVGSVSLGEILSTYGEENVGGGTRERLPDLPVDS